MKPNILVQSPPKPKLTTIRLNSSSRTKWFFAFLAGILLFADQTPAQTSSKYPQVATNYTILNSFTRNDDGMVPYPAPFPLPHPYPQGGSNVFIISPQTFSEYPQVVTNYTILHSFSANDDGVRPFNSPLTLFNGTLYGTTPDGGGNAFGTLYRINPDGSCYHVVHEFGKSGDGWVPSSQLVVGLGFSANNVPPALALFGTTEVGGGVGYGSVFRFFETNCDYEEIYGGFNADSFNGCNPEGLTRTWIGHWGWDTNGVETFFVTSNTFYGTTTYDGINQGGTVYRMNSDGSDYAIIHQFAGFLDMPTGPPISEIAVLETPTTNQSQRTVLVGTTQNGGAYSGGTMWRMQGDGSDYTVLHSFGYGDDGMHPMTPLVSNGARYGNICYGTVYSGNNALLFQIGGALGENYSILHTNNYVSCVSLTITPDGPAPGDIPYPNYTLYGAALGNSGALDFVFKINTDGTGYTVLHVFNDNTIVNDGVGPRGPMTLVTGISGTTSNVFYDVLYGTTTAGGANSLGTIFGLPVATNYSPTITTQPQSQTVCSGSLVTFSVVASGSVPLSYQWQCNNTNILNATSTTYSIASATPANAGNYTVMVSNPWGSITSATAVLAVSTSAITTVAGNHDLGGTYSGDNGPALSAGLSGPTGISLSPYGNLVFADTGNHTIRMVSAGFIYSPLNGYGGFGDTPWGVALDGNGYFYTADGDWGGIMDIQSWPNIITLGYIAETSVARDGSGNLYCVDGWGNTVSKLNSVQQYGGSWDGIVTPIAGNGNQGFPVAGPATGTPLFVNYYIWSPHTAITGSATVDNQGNVYIADIGNNVVEEVTGGNIQIVAGTGTSGYNGDDGSATSAQLRHPAAVAVDPQGNVYIADSGNNVIRRVDHLTGFITTVAGNGQAGYSGDGGCAVGAQLNAPTGLAFDASGNLYISDTGNDVIRKVTF